jgi:hypothetical protein
MGDTTTTAVVIVAAVVIGVLFLIVLVRRLGWEPKVRTAWDDVLACAVEAARVIRARPRVLWPAAILMAMSALSWPLNVAFMMKRMGVPFWDLFLMRMQRGAQTTLPMAARDLVSGIYRQPGTVAAYLWPATGGVNVVNSIAAFAALIALALTVRSWVPAANRCGAGASARLLRLLLGPLLAIGGLGIVLVAGMAVGALPASDQLRWFFVILAVPGAVLMAAWVAGVRGALFTAVGRAIGKQEPWSPPAIAAGALRHFRSLFWLAVLIEGLRAVALLANWVLSTSPGRPSSSAEIGQAIFNAVWVIALWVYVVLALAPAAAVSEDAGPLDSVRLGLRAWRRAPFHLATAIVLGWAALWVARLAGPMTMSALVGPAAVAIVLRLLGLAVQAVVMTWAAAVALLLWQRVRERVVGPGAAEAAVS